MLGSDGVQPVAWVTPARTLTSIWCGVFLLALVLEAVSVSTFECLCRGPVSVSPGLPLHPQPLQLPLLELCYIANRPPVPEWTETSHNGRLERTQPEAWIGSEFCLVETIWGSSNLTVGFDLKNSHSFSQPQGQEKTKKATGIVQAGVLVICCTGFTMPGLMVLILPRKFWGRPTQKSLQDHS